MDGHPGHLDRWSFADRWTLPVFFAILQRCVTMIWGVSFSADVRIPPRHTGRHTLNVYNTNNKQKTIRQWTAVTSFNKTHSLMSCVSPVSHDNSQWEGPTSSSAQERQLGWGCWHSPGGDFLPLQHTLSCSDLPHPASPPPLQMSDTSWGEELQRRQEALQDEREQFYSAVCKWHHILLLIWFYLVRCTSSAWRMRWRRRSLVDEGGEQETGCCWLDVL